MATRGPVLQQPASGAQLCDYCHLKPKFAGHLYCSKTCGTQAAALCNYCHKKPKFQNFEYCGKNCASLANPGGAKPAGAAAARGPGPSKGKGAPANPAQGQGLALDPMAIAQLVVQQMPQVQALLKGGGVPTQQPQQGPTLKSSSNNPFVNATPQSHCPAPNNGIPPAQFSSYSTGVNSGAHPNSLGLWDSGIGGYGSGGSCPQQQPDAEDLECLIPGCGKPVHVDAKGLKASDYCSQRHRDEAVASGLVQPCIMCLTKPQSHADYFCSRACKEESLHKQQQIMNIPNDEEEEEDDDDPQ